MSTHGYFLFILLGSQQGSTSGILIDISIMLTVFASMPVVLLP